MGTLRYDAIQRYRTVAEIGRRLGISSEHSALDVGGGTGALKDLLGLPDLTTLDPVGEGPQHIRGSMSHLPFPDRSFDLVLQTDALEHVPEEIREDSLREMTRVARRWVIWMGPVEQPETVRCEQDLCESHRELYAGREMTWLSEHRVHGLPDRDRVTRVLASGLEDWIAWPSCSLQRWWMFQRFDLELGAGPDRPELAKALNDWYETAGWREEYRVSPGAHAYRWVVVGAKTGTLPAGLEEAPGESGLDSWKGILPLFRVLLPEKILDDQGRPRSPQAEAHLERIGALLAAPPPAPEKPWWKRFLEGDG
jgi:hypothetical protein